MDSLLRLENNMGWTTSATKFYLHERVKWRPNRLEKLDPSDLFARTEANCLSMLGHVAARLPFDLRNRPVACLRTFSRRKRGILVAGNFKTCHDHDHDWEIITIERRVNCPWLIDLLLFGASDERIYLKDRVLPSYFHSLLREKLRINVTTLFRIEGIYASEFLDHIGSVILSSTFQMLKACSIEESWN